MMLGGGRRPLGADRVNSDALYERRDGVRKWHMFIGTELREPPVQWPQAQEPCLESTSHAREKDENDGLYI